MMFHLVRRQMSRVRERSSARRARQRLRVRLGFPFLIIRLARRPISFFRAFPTQPLPCCFVLLLSFGHPRLLLELRQAVAVRTPQCDRAFPVIRH
eukprot:4291382-Pyramimonas_sp.AAC.1